MKIEERITALLNLLQLGRSKLKLGMNVFLPPTVNHVASDFTNRTGHSVGYLPFNPQLFD